MTSTTVTITDPFALNDASGPTGDRLTYVEIVHERFRGRAPEEILRLSEVAPKFWDGGPYWPGDIEEASGLSEDVCKRGRTLLQRADLLDLPGEVVKGMPTTPFDVDAALEEYFGKPAERRPAEPARKPQPTVPNSRRPDPEGPSKTTAPKDQNAWALAIWNAYDLTATEKLILLGCALEFGLEKARTGEPFSQVRREIANTYLQGHAKIGETAARENLKSLVKKGWLDRHDNGKGGRGGKGRATYSPRLPS